MGRIENNLTEQVWPIAKKFEKLWDLKTTLSAGVAALELLDAAGREKACAIAKGQIEYDFVIRTGIEDIKTVSPAARIVDEAVSASTVQKRTKDHLSQSAGA